MDPFNWNPFINISIPLVSAFFFNFLLNNLISGKNSLTEFAKSCDRQKDELEQKDAEREHEAQAGICEMCE